jgi:hypothetical protein
MPKLESLLLEREQSLFVGREAELRLFTSLLTGKTKYTILNIYGPGGIGKTYLLQMMRVYAKQKSVPVAYLDAYQSGIAPIEILGLIKEGLSTIKYPSDVFAEFDVEYQEYLEGLLVGVSEQYLHELERTLTNSLIRGIERVINETAQPFVLMIDTFEVLSGKVDKWICTSLVPSLPTKLKSV